MSHDGATDASTKHQFYNDDFIIYDKITILSLQNIHFSSNVIKFVLGFIPKFDNIIA